jgi:hypothetical protein
MPILLIVQLAQTYVGAPLAIALCAARSCWRPERRRRRCGGGTRRRSDADARLLAHSTPHARRPERLNEFGDAARVHFAARVAEFDGAELPGAARPATMPGVVSSAGTRVLECRDGPNSGRWAPAEAGQALGSTRSGGASGSRCGIPRSTGSRAGSPGSGWPSARQIVLRDDCR